MKDLVTVIIVERVGLNRYRVVCDVITLTECIVSRVSWLQSHKHELSNINGRYNGWCWQFIALHWLQAMVGYNQIGFIGKIILVNLINGLKLRHMKHIINEELWYANVYNRFELRSVTSCKSIVYYRLDLRLGYRNFWFSFEKIHSVNNQTKIINLLKKDIKLIRKKPVDAVKGTYFESLVAVSGVWVHKCDWDWKIKCVTMWSEKSDVVCLVLMEKSTQINEISCFRMSLENEKTPQSNVTAAASSGSTINELNDDLDNMWLGKISPALKSENKVSPSNLSNVASPKRKRECDGDPFSSASRKIVRLTDEKLQLQISYKMMTTISMIYIIHSQHPNEFLDVEKIKELRNVIKDLIAFEPETGVEIKVQFCKELIGGLGYGCANAATVEWLKSKVPQIQLLPNVVLKTVDEMVPPFIRATVRFDFDEQTSVNFGSGIFGGMDAKQCCDRFIKRIKRQNKTLNISEWHVLKYKATDRGRMDSF